MCRDVQTDEGVLFGHVSLMREHTLIHGYALRTDDHLPRIRQR